MTPLVQYILVFIILAATIVWILVRLFSKKHRQTSGCCGCALGETCAKKQIVEKEKGGKCEDLKNF